MSTAAARESKNNKNTCRLRRDQLLRHRDHDTMVSKCILHSIDFRVSCEASLQRRDLKIESQCFYFYELLNNTSTSYCLLVVSVNVAITHVSVTISPFLT